MLDGIETGVKNPTNTSRVLKMALNKKDNTSNELKMKILVTFLVKLEYSRDQVSYPRL